jgi:XTP/dITP diphosphohydrolase
MNLYVATTNPGKLRDFATAAAHANFKGGITILPLPGLQEIPPPDEDQPTFSGNAILKARYYSAHAPGQIVLADDSGLEVDALHGDPGVRSARYAEDACFPQDLTQSLDTRNNHCLLQALASTPAAARTARYRCVLAAARSDGSAAGQFLHTASGAVEGMILAAPRGNNGFGYDPLFYLPDYDLTMAELDQETRLSLSHRGRALAQLLSTFPLA